MVIHDEDTLEQALSLLATDGSVRYSDTFSYVIITTPETLEKQVRSAFDRGDIAIVCPVGQERSMEVHSVELGRVKARRRVQEKKEFQEFMRSNPEFKKAVDEAYKKNPRLNVGKFISHWKKIHGFEGQASEGA